MRAVRIYLSGPMLGCDRDFMKKWRDRVQEELGHMNYKFIDPSNVYYDNEAEHSTEVVLSAEQGVIESDIVLAYVPFYSMGTSCEILWAHQKHKIIMTVLEAENESAFIRKYSNIIFNNLDDAIDFLRSQVYLP